AVSGRWSRRGILDDDAHQLALDDDDLAHRLALDPFAHAVISQRRGTDLFVTGVGGDADASAQLAVDLYHDLDIVLEQRAGIGNRPGVIHQRIIMAKRVPQYVAGMRHDRRQHLHDQLDRLAPDDAALRRGVVELRQRIHQLHDCGDSRIEYAPAAD